MVAVGAKQEVFAERLAELLKQEQVTEPVLESQPTTTKLDETLVNSEPVYLEPKINVIELPELVALAAPETIETVFKADEQPTALQPEIVEDGLGIVGNAIEQATAEYLETDGFGPLEIVLADEITEETPVWPDELELVAEVGGLDLEMQVTLPETATTIAELLPIEPGELAEKLQTIPMERLEEVTAILEAVIQTAQRFETIENIDSEQITIELTQMVERLLVCLEIEHDETQVAAFVEAILSGDLELDFDVLLARQDEGMHERKYTSAWIMAVLNQQTVAKENRHSFIGRCVMRLSLLDAQLSWAA